MAKVQKWFPKIQLDEVFHLYAGYANLKSKMKSLNKAWAQLWPEDWPEVEQKYFRANNKASETNLRAVKYNQFINGTNRTVSGSIVSLTVIDSNPWGKQK